MNDCILTYPMTIFQWDSDISLNVNADLIMEDGTQYVHYQHKGASEVYSVAVTDGMAAIPNIILQTAGAFEAYAYVNGTSGKTLVRKEFAIIPRPTPPEYIYDPTPVITYPELVDLVEDLTALQGALSSATADTTTLEPGEEATVSVEMTEDEMLFHFGIPQGATGAAGRGIVSIERVSRVGLVDRYQITYTDGTTWNYAVTNGAQGATGATGNGILKIEKVSTVGLVDTYRVTYTSGNTYEYTVTNGADGEDGATGATGNGIASIAKTSTSGLVDTYTITYTNGQTTTFTVTNGADGNTIQSDWEQSDSTADDYIKHKPLIESSTDETVILSPARDYEGLRQVVMTLETDYPSGSGCRVRIQEHDIDGEDWLNIVLEGIATPTSDNHAANKGYVDSAIATAIGDAIGGSY